MKDKKAKFFCENCGAEVEQNAKFCRSCGRFFTSVRCPACGCIGIAAAFTSGCPSCGYADSTVSPAANNTSSNGKHSHAHYSDFNTNSSSGAKNKNADSPLPVWIYLFTIAALAGIVAAIIYLFVKA